MALIHQIEQFETANRCGECGSKKLVLGRGTIVCSACGLENGKIIFQEEKVLSLHNKNETGSRIFYFNERFISPNQPQKFREYTRAGKFAKLQQKTRVFSQTHFDRQASLITRIADYFDIPITMRKRVEYLYSEYSSWRQDRTIKSAALITLAFIISARERHFPLTMQEIMNYFRDINKRIRLHDINHACNLLKIFVPLPRPIDFLPQVLNSFRKLAAPPYELLYKMLAPRPVYTQHVRIYLYALCILAYQRSYPFLELDKILACVPRSNRTILNVYRKLRNEKYKR